MTFLARMALVWPVAVVMHLTPCAEKKHPSREQRCDNLTMRRRASGSIDRLLPPGAAYCDQQPRGILKLLDLRGREPESGLRISALGIDQLQYVRFSHGVARLLQLQCFGSDVERVAVNAQPLGVVLQRPQIVRHLSQTFEHHLAIRCCLSRERIARSSYLSAQRAAGEDRGSKPGARVPERLEVVEQTSCRERFARERRGQCDLRIFLRDRDADRGARGVQLRL